MIVFDLKCANEHVFEAWFASSDDFESQKKRKLLSCPFCEDGRIEKALMAPAVGRKSNQRDDSGPSQAMSLPASPDDMTPAQRKKLFEALAKMQAAIEANSDYVGEEFADEARRIQSGEAKERPITGEATLEDARELLEEGIGVMPLPFRSRRKRADA